MKETAMKIGTQDDLNIIFYMTCVHVLEMLLMILEQYFCLILIE